MRARMRVTAAVFTLLGVVTCGGGNGAGPTGLPKVDVVLGDVLRIEAEVAAKPADRSNGLMNRASLPRNAGMLFVFREPGRANFYMKNTLIPLDIAFIGRGIVLEIRTMEPCPADTERCPLTIPQATYEMALEVNAGVFKAAGIGPGTPVRIEGKLPKPD